MNLDLSSSPEIWAPVLMLGAAIALLFPSVLSYLRSRRDIESVERRLARRGPELASPEQRRNQSRIGKAVAGMADQMAPGDDEQGVSAAKLRLASAGFTGKSAVGRYYFARLVCMVLPQLCLLAVLPYLADLPGNTPLIISVMLVMIGLIAPGMYLDKRAKARQQDCSAGFPDMMDLLVACVEAGLSLDASVQRVGEELELRHPIIAGFMRTLSLELRAGRARKTAWRSFADRMGIEEAGSLATMLRQAEEMGTSLGQTLRVFSADMRQRRILYAEEKAMALPAKLTLPLVFFVFPVLLGVLILPAVVMFQEVL